VADAILAAIAAAQLLIAARMGIAIYHAVRTAHDARKAARR